MTKFEISIFPIDGDFLIADIPLENADPKEIKTVIGLDPNEEAVYEYKIDKTTAGYFERRFGVEFDFSKYEYHFSPYEID